ncbi:hypothetical protein AXF42_Ash001427 [Apostasia shenzhenica]|uniref:Retrotransposon gag domain-containing protein n=1 Tax=Apostasia shenzhenica TaxID=1088818 RepID=A0A2I0AUV4_9ASPA|nr:hypothetical protein AXF42_Ash001427 [Apostasia shenzhenica]
MENAHDENAPPPPGEQQATRLPQDDATRDDRQLQTLTNTVATLTQTMNTFLASLPALLQQQRPLPLALPLKGPLQQPGVERVELPTEETSTHAAAESRPEVYPPAPSVDTIFSSAIMAALAPRAYKAPRVSDYNGLTDPAQHVKRFENALATSDPVSDAYKCRLFRNTLTGLALDWLDEVPQGSIQSFLQFSEQFRTRFGTSKTTSRTIHELWQIRQAPDESLRNYVDRFSKMNAETKDTTDDRSTMIFVHSILPGELYESFVDNMPKTLMEARARTEKHIHLEDAKALKAKAKQEVASPQTKKGEAPRTDSNTPRRSFRDRNFSPFHGKRKFEGESPRPATPVYIIEGIFSILSDKGFIKNHGERQPPQPSEDPTKFCKFHQRYGHLLFECRSFPALVNEYIENGYLTGYKRIEGPLPKVARPLFPINDPRGPPSSTAASSKADGKKAVLSIFGYHSGLKTRRYQEVCTVELPPLLPDIIFTAGDLPRGGINRDDPIVVIAEIGACDVHRTLVDTGSSVDILYLCAFNEMVVGPCKPLPPSMTISSFSGDVYRPAGYATLRVALEEGPKRIIMDAPSGYNAILGCPAIAAFQMVASTYHLCKVPHAFRSHDHQGGQGRR